VNASRPVRPGGDFRPRPSMLEMIALRRFRHPGRRSGEAMAVAGELLSERCGAAYAQARTWW